MADPDIAAIAAGLTKAQRAMIKWSRESWDGPHRCYGRGITKKALRDKGICCGEFNTLTPLGLQVRAYLKEMEDE